MLPSRPLIPIALATVLTIPALLTGAAPDGAAALGTQAGAALGGSDLVTAIVLGAEHPASAGGARATLAAEWERAARPFVASVAAEVARAGGSVVSEWPFLPGLAVVVPPASLASLAARPDVRSVTLDRPDALAVPKDEPGDTRVADAPGRAMMQVPEIWARGHFGAHATVGIVDTGIDPSHEAFRRSDGSSRVAAWQDFVGNSPLPYDDHGHGTFVAGVAVGSTDYVDPVYGRFQEPGVAPQASIVAAKFLDSGGSGSYTSAISALQFVWSAGADVSINAWGGPCVSAATPVLAAVRSLTDAGMLSVVSAGSGGPTPSSIGAPGCGESALTIGTVTSSGEASPGSSRGPCTDVELGTPARTCPDLVAKGDLVRSAVPRSGATNGDPSGYRTWSGSSGATGHAAGAAALAEDFKVALTGVGWDTAAREEESLLKLTAFDVPPPGPDNATGWGIPQLLTLHDLLGYAPEPALSVAFSVGRAEMRDGDANPVLFAVRNLGTPEVRGDFRAEIVGPDGAVTVLYDSAPVLARFDEERFFSTFFLPPGAPVGVWTFRGSFAYEWTNATTNGTETGVVEEEASFTVRRVLVGIALEGLAREAPLLVPQDLVLRATNVGNEDARNVRVELAFRDAYRGVPRLEGSEPTSYASPRPSSVTSDPNFARSTFVWELPTLPAGESASFSVRLSPTAPGEFRFVGSVRYENSPGQAFAEGAAWWQSVLVVPPGVIG